MQRVEIRNSVDTKNYRLAIYYELLLPVLERGLDDPWIALGPVIAVAADEPHGSQSRSTRKR
jgi:hypothetical protein